ncbi:MAG: ATP-grasp domain-containing protein [Cycloclasticus sp.]|nr:ATP-grasp domain-containing protein [Cycloclasticus sp.]
MLRQQTKLVKIKTPVFPKGSLKKIEEWMSLVFELDIPDADNNQKNEIGSLDGEAFEISRCAQQLINTFLQFANIPAFYLDKNIHVSAEQTDGNIEVTLPVPLIEMTRSKPYEIAVASTFRILSWMARNEVSQQNIQQLYKIVEVKVLAPLKSFYAGGKSTLRVLRVLNEKNIPFMSKGFGTYQLGWGSKSHQLTVTGSEADSVIGVQIAQDKVKSAMLLYSNGLPAPEHVVVNSKESAINAAKKLGWPIVVKPIRCDRGEGVVIGINNSEALSKAYDHALKFSPRSPVIVEKEVPGICHRIFITSGQLLYVSKRWPISVIGDGHKKVSQLIASANEKENAKSPWLRTSQYPNDPLAKKILKMSGFSMDSVPNKNERIALRPFESNEWGGSSEDVTPALHIENLNLAVRAAKIFGLHNAGIDFISPDISVPWHQNGAVINEVNFSPELGANSASLACIPAFISKLVKGDGRIPIDVFVGGDAALKQAKKKHKEQLVLGVKSCLTTSDLTLYLSEEELKMPFNSLTKRCRALLMDKEVEGLVVSIQTDEVLYGGNPVDQINSLKMVDRKLTAWKEIKTEISNKNYDALSKVLQDSVINVN